MHLFNCWQRSPSSPHVSGEAGIPVRGLKRVGQHAVSEGVALARAARFFSSLGAPTATQIGFVMAADDPRLGAKDPRGVRGVGRPADQLPPAPGLTTTRAKGSPNPKMGSGVTTQL